MTIQLKTAKQLCSAEELKLVQSSLGKDNRGLTTPRLKQKVALCRRLRDKYRDESQRQRRESRGRAAPHQTRAAKPNDRTVQKVRLFNETLDRFAAKLKVAEGQSKATTRSAVGGAKTRSVQNAKSAAPAKRGKMTAARPAAKRAAKPSPARSTNAEPSKPEPKRPKAPPEASKSAEVNQPALLSATSDPSRGGPSSLLSKDSQGPTEGKKPRRSVADKRGLLGTQKSHFSRVGQEKIHGHISGRTRRNQARRDSKG